MKKTFFWDVIFETRHRWLRHVFFWLASLLFFIFLEIPESKNLYEAVENPVMHLPESILYTYVIVYWLVPKYLMKEKYLVFFLLYVAWAGLGLILDYSYRYFIIIPLREGRSAPPTWVNADYRNAFSLGSFVVMNNVPMFAVFIKLFKYWYQEQKQKLQMEKEKVSAELQLLKAQLHPHFLFNTLNNLYSLVHEKSDKAPTMLMRLSGLLSYVLYECKADEVSLEKEISVIKDYIALEQERYGERLDVSLNFSGDIKEKMIAPMLFQPLVENAFKHGTSEQLGKVWMSIDLSVKNNQLIFKIINSCESNGQEKEYMGIGINNVKKRVELLYHGKFQLLYGKEGDVYVASLAIELRSPVTKIILKQKADTLPQMILDEDPMLNSR